MCADTSRGAAIRELISQALKGPLAPAQQEVYCYLSFFRGLFARNTKKWQFIINITHF
jgi:hypothetical protein